MNAKGAVPMRITLEELDHPQPATPIRTDNSTADGIMNKTVEQEKSKSMDTVPLSIHSSPIINRILYSILTTCTTLSSTVLYSTISI
jgi:hypothetical protein